MPQMLLLGTLRWIYVGPLIFDVIDSNTLLIISDLLTYILQCRVRIRGSYYYIITPLDIDCSESMEGSDVSSLQIQLSRAQTVG